MAFIYRSDWTAAWFHFQALFSSAVLLMGSEDGGNTEKIKAPHSHLH